MNKTVLQTDIELVKRKICTKTWLFKRYKDNPEAMKIIISNFKTNE